ncbi:MAG: type II secretion system protein [Rickettsiales bacterium]
MFLHDQGRLEGMVKRNSAFSLVELSIVLVILGLLVGGILSGQALIRAAELRSIATDYSRYISASHTFRDKYFSPPGDMANATAFWGTKANCGAASPGATGTCNGNSDGFVNMAAAAGQTGESFMAWQHLTNAGLIEGQYTGVAGPGATTDADYGTNAPRSKLSNGGWQLGARTSYITGSGVNFDGFWRTWLLISADNNLGGDPLFSPEEAWNIDTKIDDGKPGRGKAITRYSNCTNAANGADLDAAYLFAVPTKVCDLRFIEVF